MADMIGQNWILLVLALLLGIVVVWRVLGASRRGKVEIEREETEAGGPARRNQALIDAPPAAAREATEPPVPDAPIAPVVPDAPVVPIAVEQPAAAQEAAPAAPATPPAPGEGDDLTRIKGLGPKLAEQLLALGVTRFAQIAAWDDAEIDRIDANLGRFRGRIRRDNWPEQARFLASNDVAGYETRFGKL